MPSSEKVPRPTATPPSQEQAERLRLLRFLAELCDLHFGSLWWVQDDLWLQADVGFKKPNRGMRAHPGACIRYAPPISPYEDIPMLFGASGGRGPVVVRDLTGDAATRVTSFGLLTGPALLEPEDFFSRKEPREKARALRNDRKPDCNADEERQLATYVVGVCMKEGGTP